MASGDVAELREEIAANLRLELKRKIEAKVKEQALAALRQKAEFAVPRALVDAEAQNMAKRMAAELAEQGMKTEDMKLGPELFRASAEDRVALGLALGEVVRLHGLQAKPEQVKALLQEAAQTYEQPEAVVRWHYETARAAERVRGPRGRTQCRRLGARAGTRRGRADDVRGADGPDAPLTAGARAPRAPCLPPRRPHVLHRTRDIERSIRTVIFPQPGPEIP